MNSSLNDKRFNKRFNYEDTDRLPYAFPIWQRPVCPRTWVVESLLVTLFCFFPLGIPAMWFASKVERYFALGDYDAAEAASVKARNLVVYALCIGSVVAAVSFWLYITGTVNPHELSMTI